MGNCPVRCAETPQGLGGSGRVLFRLFTGGRILGAFQPHAQKKGWHFLCLPFTDPGYLRAFSHKLHFWKLLSIQTHHCVTNSEKSPPKIMEMQRSPVGLADTLLLS